MSHKPQRIGSRNTKEINLAKTTSTAFSATQRLVHWLTAALVFFNLLLPDGMNTWRRSMRQTGSATAYQVSSANIHAYVGIAILILVVFRLILRASKGVPPSPSEEPAIFRLAAKAGHAAFYILLIAMPLTGIGAYYLGYDGLGNVHADILKVVMWFVIVAHVLSVLAHQFYFKTNILRRMTLG
jgi:cytochrome b561